MSVRNEVRKLIAALPVGAEFDYTTVKHLKSGGQALVDLKDMGEVVLVRRGRVNGGCLRNIYVAAKKSGVMAVPAEAMSYMLGGNPTAAPPKGKKTVHRCL